jgi:Zn-dependent peptidase ImmA (M78 family)
VPATPDPWSWLSKIPGLKVITERLDGDRMGLYLDSERLIKLDDRLNAAEERCTFAHEFIHAERRDHGLCGLSPDGRRLDDLQERQVSRLAALRLILLEHLAEVLARTYSVAEAADDLHVDEDTLWHRLEGLNETEATYLQRRIERIEEVSWPT